MEINPAYRKLLKVIKTHGVTEWGVPPQGNPEVLGVDEFTVCREAAWTDQQGNRGSLRLSATPDGLALGLVELTMTLSGASSSSRAYFEIRPRGISVRSQQYNQISADWEDSGVASSGANYQEHLLKTGDILEERFSHGK